MLGRKKKRGNRLRRMEGEGTGTRGMSTKARKKRSQGGKTRVFVNNEQGWKYTEFWHRVTALWGKGELGRE